jgi:polyferredoxin
MFSRLGRFLGWRSYPQRALESRLRFVKFILLSLMLLAVWWSGERFWASFNPMQHAFAFTVFDWMSLIILSSLIASLFYFRFWCRYFCPFGAFLALSNKIALLQRFAPKRRLEHCDLGVKDEFDIDCIRCNRCLSGKDCGVRHASGEMGATAGKH